MKLLRYQFVSSSVRFLLGLFWLSACSTEVELPWPPPGAAQADSGGHNSDTILDTEQDAASGADYVGDVHLEADVIDAVNTEGDAPDIDDEGDTAHSDAGAEDIREERLPPIPDWGFCQGVVNFAHTPGQGSLPPPFPDDFFTVDVDMSPTGLTVDFTVERAPYLAVFLPPFNSLPAAMSTLDGFTTTGGLFLPFDGQMTAPPSGWSASLASEELLLVELRDGKATRVPFEARLADNGQTIAAWPMVPLRPKTLHAFVATANYLTADGDCASPSDALMRIITRTAPASLARLYERYDALFEATGLEPRHISGAVVFTTQSIEDESLAVAADIRGRNYTWVGPASCNQQAGPHGPVRVCERAFSVYDYSVDGEFVGAPPVGSYTLAARWWYPPTDEDDVLQNDIGQEGGVVSPEPLPAVIFGHGLSSSRHQGGELSPRIGNEGFLVIAIDAPGHGDHPSAPKGAPQIEAMLQFFGFNVQAFSFAPLRLRDVWRRATADKLQLLELLEQDPDLDGDGQPDINPERIAYIGASLGGIMGPEFLALSRHVETSVLMIAGARLAFMVSDSPQLGNFVPLVAGNLTPGDIDRLFSFVQMVADKGDGANYAPHVIANRHEVGGQTSPGPDVLVTMALGDEVVPNSTTRMLARSLGIPQVEPVLMDIDGGQPYETAPLSENMLPDGRTGGLFQFDRITKKTGQTPVLTDHDDLPKSLESMAQTLHWLHTWWESGVPEILDPYELLGTPLLP